MLRHFVNDAVRSDAKAITLIISMIDRYGETPETKLRLDELLAEDRDILTRFALPSEETDDAIAAGVEPTVMSRQAEPERQGGG